MAKGSKIVVTPDPMGRFFEGTLTSGQTPKPGTIMQIDTSVAIDGSGRFTWKVYAPGSDGIRCGLWAVLIEDDLQGRTETTAYVAGDRIRLYRPLPGDELNMILQDVSGTADDHAVGEQLIADTGTGKLIATTGSPESEPFMLLEAVTDPVADTLAWCVYTGE